MAVATVAERGEVLLAFVEKLVEMPGLTWVDASNAVFYPGGPYVRLFPTRAQRQAFRKSPAGRRIDDLIWSLPSPPVRPAPEERGPRGHVEIIRLPGPKGRAKRSRQPNANGRSAKTSGKAGAKRLRKA